MSVVPSRVLPKVSVVSERVTAGVATNPVPFRLTVCGFPLALSAMLRVAARAPAAFGAKVTVTVQLDPVAIVVPHVLVAVKELAAAPGVPTEIPP